jgi:hypothetical protein
MPRLANLKALAVLPALISATTAFAESASSLPTAAAATPQPGRYCPGLDTLYLTLEEVTVALRAIVQAKENLLVLKDAPTAGILLTQAGAALASAAGRGSGPRTATLIDVVIAAKSDADPRDMLLWFPNLKHAMAGMVAGPAVQAAKRHVADAEAILQGQTQGDEIELLRKARQLLVCDPLDIPLQEAQKELRRLNRASIQGKSPTAEDFVRLTDLLNRGLTYGHQRLVDLERQ